jgi:hypothetical protein
MEKLGTKSMEEPFFPDVNYATPEIAESWKRHYEQENLKMQNRRKRPLLMFVLVWMTISEDSGISWRQLAQIYTRHSLDNALRKLLRIDVIKRVEETDYDGRGRKPVRYYCLGRPFVPVPAKTVRSKYGKTHFFGKWVMRKSNRAEQSVIIKDPNSKGAFPFKKVVRKPPPKRFVRLFPEEKKGLDDYMAWIKEKRSKELQEGKASKNISNT